MPHDMTPADQAAIAAIIAALEDAWNAGDGNAYAAPMTDDADFVTIRAEHFRGRQAIAEGHAAIFRTLYAGSKNRYTLDSARLLSDDVALIHVKAVLNAPTGPLAGRHEALFSAILVREHSGWRIASFHNTLVPLARH
ncbi:MAG: SgcJ/EcaC family oxidoreductase [Terriglobia bacterium]